MEKKPRLMLSDICHYSKYQYLFNWLYILHQEIKLTLTVLTRCLIFSICSSGSLSLVEEGKKKQLEQTWIVTLELLAVTDRFLFNLLDSHSPSYDAV